MRAQLARTDLVERRSLPLPLRARQGARGRAGLRRRPSSTTRQGNRLRREVVPLRRRRHHRATCGAASALFTREFFAAARGLGRTGAGSDLHRRPAARGFDAGRADPGEPFRGRRHDGTAGHRRHRAELRRTPERRRKSSKYPEVLETLDADELARARRALPASRRASSARPTRRSSSTRCRTTSRTSA